MLSPKLVLWLGWGLAGTFFGTTAFLAWRHLLPGPGVGEEKVVKIKEGTSGPINPEPVRFVKYVLVRDKLLRPTMAGGMNDLCSYEYRGGFVDCWLEAESDGKKEALGRISGDQLRKQVQKWSPELENNVHGNIYWDPFASGPDDVNLLVTATADESPALATHFEVRRGVTHRQKEKVFWKKGEELLSIQGPTDSLLRRNEEMELCFFNYQGGKLRLMCKLASYAP